ncbi:MAG: hypothetical protein D6B25_10110 [Desulfobulbaceae bacterium]|nr:MAG: hypothetical protein D6B25_10110 [Desulfobulbaceae bacterium]
MTQKPLDFDRVAAYSLDQPEPEIRSEQFATVCQEGSSLQDYLRSLPTIGSGKKFRELIQMLADVKRAGRPLVLGIGSSILLEGMSPVIEDLIDRGLISGLALSGEGLLRDVEMAVTGGMFNVEGTGVDTLFNHQEAARIIVEGVNYGADNGLGLGEAIGTCLVESDFEHRGKSLLVIGQEKGVTVTIHPTIGAEIAHLLPNISGEALGKTAHLDFRIFSGQVANIQGGAYINSGSYHTLPQVFKKALIASRALGYQADDFFTVFLGGSFPAESEQHWLASVDIPSESCCFIDGPFGILYPLMAACLLDELSETC